MHCGLDMHSELASSLFYALNLLKNVPMCTVVLCDGCARMMYCISVIKVATMKIRWCHEPQLLSETEVSIAVSYVQLITQQYESRSV